MTDKQIVGLLLLIGIPIICIIILTLICNYWINLIKKNKNNIQNFLHDTPQNKEKQEKQEFRQASKPLTQQSFEEWKAEKKKRDQGGFVDLDAPIILLWRRAI